VNFNEFLKSVVTNSQSMAMKQTCCIIPYIVFV